MHFFSSSKHHYNSQVLISLALFSMESPAMALSGSHHSKLAYEIEAKRLSYKLCSWIDDLNVLPCIEAQNRAPRRFVLRDVSCKARPGELTAIAGPSGAGKSTLIEILAGKIRPRECSGRVLVNDRMIDAKSFRRISGYVTQDDALFPLLTVEETLTYSALLRLGGGRLEARSRVRELLKVLGLGNVAGSRVGGASNRGISGGERRRVSIGVELVHDPAVILMDEPTSGLDSASALHVVSLLRLMAASQGKTIILTIHQPGFRILELIDRIVLLSNGFVVHSGSLKLLEERLKFAGHFIPRHVNVLEFAIDVVDSLFIQTWGTLTHQQHLHRRNNKDGEIVRAPSSNGTKGKPLLFYPNSWFREVLMLGQRNCKNIVRTKQLFAARMIQAVVAGLLLGTIFLNVGHDQGKVVLQTRLGFFAFSLTFLLSSTTEGLPIFLQERRILMRETSRGAYRVSSYVLANSLIFIPFLLVASLLYATPVYWLVGLRRDIDGFLYFSMVVWMVVSMATSFVACFSALVPDFIMGTSVIAGFMGSFFLFSGYFISKGNIPRYWIFMHYMSLFKYPFECFLINEYGGQQGRTRCTGNAGPGSCKMYGDEFLRQQGLKESQRWTNVGVMLGFIIGYRMLSFLILWYRCYRTRN